jgi:hypothetical protein
MIFDLNEHDLLYNKNNNNLTLYLFFPHFILSEEHSNSMSR